MLGRLVDLVDLFLAHLTTHKHVSDYVNVVVLFEKMLVDQEVCEAEFVETQIVLDSLSISCT